MNSSYTINFVSRDTVFITDDDNGGWSVTNDAERVVEAINERYPNRRIVYKDTCGYWDELVHKNGEFLTFGNIQELSLIHI